MMTIRDVSEDLRTGRQMLYWYDRLALPLSLLPGNTLPLFVSPLPADVLHALLDVHPDLYLHRVPLSLVQGMRYRFNEYDGLPLIGVGCPGIPWNRIIQYRTGFNERVINAYLRYGERILNYPVGVPTVSISVGHVAVRCLDPVLVVK